MIAGAGDRSLAVRELDRGLGADGHGHSQLELGGAARLDLATRMLRVHGTADQHVPIAQSQRYATALGAAGATVETSFVEGADHFFSTVTAEQLAEVVDGSIEFLLRVATVG